MTTRQRYDRLLSALAERGVLAPPAEPYYGKVGWRHLILRAKPLERLTVEQELALRTKLRDRAKRGDKTSLGAEIVLHYSANANVIRGGR